MYVTQYFGELFIIDITDLNNPQIINNIEGLYNNSYRVDVSDGYAYVASVGSSLIQGNLYIIDIDPPESAYIVKTININGGGVDVQVENGYAYVAACYAGLQIIDIDPPQDAAIVKTVETPNSATWAVDVAGDYAYVGDVSPFDEGFYIVDISIPESAYIINSVDVPSRNYGIFIRVVDGYAYCATDDLGFQIVDVDPPESAYVVRTVDTGRSLGVEVVDGYAFVRPLDGYTTVVDVSRPETATIKREIGWDGRININNGYVFHGSYDSGEPNGYGIEIWELW